MKTAIFLILINVSIIFCFNKIKILRHLSDSLYISDSFSESIYLSTDIKTDDSKEKIEPLFLGVDHYSSNGTVLTFLAYFFSENTTLYKNETTFNVQNISRLRMLQENKITCPKKPDSKEVGVYECSYIGSIDKIKITYPGNNKTDYAEYSLSNIKDQVGEIISSEAFFFIKDCTIPNPTKNVINGNIDYNIVNNTEGTVYITDDNIKEEVPITFIKGDDNNYNIKLDLKKDLNKNLNQTTGKLNDKNVSYVFLFKEGESSNSTIDYDFNPTVNKGYGAKKSSNGLSGGAIVAIILPCIAALLAVLGLAFFLSKSSSGAVTTAAIPMENINMANQTIGINSSTNVVNK